MRFAPRLALLAAIGLLLSGDPARAQDAAAARFRLDPLQPSSPHSPFFSVEGPVPTTTSGMDRLALEVLATYVRAPLTVHMDRDGQEDLLGTPVQNALLAHFAGSFRVTSQLSFDAAMPMTIAQNGRDIVVGSARVDAPQSAALGDVRIGMLWRGWFTESTGFVAGLRGWAPTGNQDAYASDGRFRGELLVGAVARASRSRAGCTAAASPTFFAPRTGDRLSIGCAADVRPLDGGPWLGGEVTANALRIDPDIATGFEGELWATAHLPAGPFRMGLSAGPGVGSSPGTPAFRAIASFAWTPSAEDRPRPTTPVASLDPDFDGVRGAADACPGEAGPSSDEPSINGCPRRDSDEDGIDDSVDSCPSEKGSASDSKESNGCPDRDNDHVADALDRCPDEPGRHSADPASSGCPRYARLRGDRFELTPGLSAASEHPDTAADDQTLWEVAFSLRSAPNIRKLAVEVRLQAASDDDIEATADRAVEIANDIVRRLVDLGVDRRRLDPVGAVADVPGVVLHVVDGSAQH